MRSHLRTVCILLLTVGLLAFFLRNADLAGVWREIQHAQAWLLLLAVVITGMTYVLRAGRWLYLLRPVGTVRFSNAFRTTVIGFAVSFLLPARAGEFIRPYLLARREALSVTASFATIVLERLLDLMTVLLLFGSLLFVFEPGLVLGDQGAYQAVKVGAGVAAVGALVALALAALLAGHPERLGRAALRIERLLPAALAGVLARAIERFADGLAIARQPGRLLVSLGLSLPLWLSIAAGIWLTARAFHVTLPYTGSFLVMAILVVGVSVPTPGAIGGFHAAFQLAVTTFYGVAADRAVGAGLVLHAVSFLPVTALGLIFMVQDGMSLGGMRRLASRRREEPTGAAAPPRGAVAFDAGSVGLPVSGGDARAGREGTP